MKLLNNTITKNQIPNEFPNILPSNQYTDLKVFYLENTIQNTKQIYHQLTPPNKQRIYNMEVPIITDCSFYGFCKNTNVGQNRYNRILQPRNILSSSLNNQPLYNFVQTYDTPYRNAIMNSGLSTIQKQTLMDNFTHSNKVEPMYNQNETAEFDNCKSIPCIHIEKILGSL